MGTLIWELPSQFDESNVPTSVKKAAEKQLKEVLPLFLATINMKELCALRLFQKAPDIIDYAKKVAANEMLAVVADSDSPEKN